MRLVIDVVKEEKKWSSSLLSKRYIKEVATYTLNYAHRPYPKSLEMCLLLTNDNKLKELNKKFRDKDRPTNVLSFPDIDYNDTIALEKVIQEDYLYLGDIAFAYETIMEESQLQNKTFLNHFTHLLVHSLLHLLGYDHIKQKDAEIMEKVEVDILKQFGIKNPYLI